MAGRLNWEEYAARAWPILASYAAKRSLITYGTLGSLIGLHHRSVRFALSVIQDYCLEEELPPLTILIINQDSGLPGPGFIAVDADHLESAREEVYAFDWQSRPNPLAYAAAGWSEEELADRVVANPQDAEPVYQLVRDRGRVQAVFRKALLAAYGCECAFCGLSLPQALEGAHIIRWAEASNAERLDVRNGLLLCSVHHRLFDAGIVIVDTDGTIRFTGRLADQVIEIDMAMTSALDGCRLHMPEREDHQPSREALAWREEAARAGRRIVKSAV